MTRTTARLGRALIGAGLACALGLSLAACGPSGGQSGDSGASGSTGGDKVVSMAFRTPNWILPISAPGFTQGENAIFGTALYRPLYNYKLASESNHHIDLDKSLGEAPTFSEDGLTMTIKLRDATWSDGKPITTRDVEFWWNLVTNNKDKWASYRKGAFPDNIAKFAVVDEHTFTLTTTQKYSPGWFVGNQLNKISILPQHVWDKTSADSQVGDHDRTPAEAVKVFDFLTEQSKDLSTYATNPLWKVTSGPWQIASYVPNGQVELVPSPTYWGADKAKVSKLVLRPFTGDDAEFNVLRAGELDYGYIPASNVSQVSYMEGKGYTVDPWYGLSITYIPFNFANPKTGPIFKQKYVRQAMQQLIDQPTISEKIWGKMAAPTCGPVPQPADKMGTMDGCAYSFDPAAAKKLLEDNGWTVVPDGQTTCTKPGTGAGQCGADIAQGTPLTFKLISQSGFSATSKMMAEIKSQMAKVGITLEIQEVPDSVSVSQKCEAGAECAWDLSFFGSQGSWYFPVYASGERLFATDAPVNLGLYSDAKADQLIEASQFSDDAAALKAYNDYLAEDLPVLWMPNPVYQISAYKKVLQGVAPQDPLNLMYPEDWSWK
ncbi:peptide ABC transporter substrate-binding protein [Schaalia sp. 19OD2882]|uniref:peptide ABC transporter substrate-binding protein n=1 Tax=Schaalia sp. 19OD2882 TaxID=2794089 RepID=UPI001C1EACB9|nr:peptide ABC transporter substrate-binding protein [Schaalia sp. 19OD2882]QWW20511.1 peptide ABC transporter substrate-binding protein [Schaalia sp. 19OD2882]